MVALPVSSSFVNIVLTSILLCQFTECYDNVVSIDPLNGNDTLSCLAGNTTCKTLPFSFSGNRSSTKYVFFSGTHILNSYNATFKDLATLGFVGDNSTIHCTGDSAGFAFINVTDIHFSDISFSNCSFLRKSTSRNYSAPLGVSYFRVGLYFLNCVSVTMEHVEVSNSYNATGVVMYNTNGSNNISHCAFRNNRLTHPVGESTTNMQPGGGGFYVEFTYCDLNQAVCNDSTPASVITDATFTFEYCQFTENIANDSGTSTYIVPYHNDHNAFGRGGGLSIFVKGNSSHNTFKIVECSFSKNRALWGAGLFVEFHDTAFNNLVSVQKSNFSHNICPYTADSGTAGGGMRIGHYVYGESGTESTGNGNWIQIDGCLFRNNRALNGGGLSVSATPQKNIVNANQLSLITITDTNFTRNSARLGSAVHIDRFQLILVGQVLDINVTRCSFSENSINFLPPNYDGAYQVGVGTVFVHNVPIHFVESATFTNNTGSGLAVVVGEVNFCNCSASFVSNTGNNGGGIALLGEAYIKVNDGTLMKFVDNRATVHGGGIYNKYISRENLATYSQCFVRHTEARLVPNKWGAQFKFSGNKDLGDSRNSAIHTTSILPCSWAGGSGLNKNKSDIFCWKGWSYTNENGTSVACKEEINTDVGEITKQSSLITAYPGQPFSLQLNITDDLGKEKNKETDIETAFIGSISRDGSTKRNSFFRAWENETVIKAMGNVTLVLDTVEEREWQISLRVELQPCPPGFSKSSNGTDDVSCVCSTDKSYGGAIFCDYHNFTAFLKNGYWIGVAHMEKEDSKYVVSVCPVGFCSVSDSLFIRLNKTSKEVNEQICGERNRNGTLCGSCKKGYGPAINSHTFDCVDCRNVSITHNVVKYIAAVYIPTAVLFTVIIIFRIQLTSGAANSFILFSQLVSSMFNLDADGLISTNLLLKANSGVLKSYQFIYGIFNLEFVENFLSPLCVGEGINTLTIISTDYGVALAPLLMILVIIAVVKMTDFIGSCCVKRNYELEHREVDTSAKLTCKDVMRYMNKALLSAFAAYLLLSYTKFTLTSSQLLQMEPLLNESGHETDGPQRVYFAGDFSAHDHYYITHYLIPSCIILVIFVAVPPILLLDYPLRAFEMCLMRANRLWRHYPAGKIHVLLDTFQGCFKPKFRFFAGLYFLFRLTISINYIVTKTLMQQYVVQQIACTIMFMLVGVCQPYNKKNRFFNLVDMLMFSNLAIINALTIYLYESTQNSATSSKPPVSAFAIQYILIYLPLVYMLVYALWYLCAKLGPCRQCMSKYFGAKSTAWSTWWKPYTPLDSHATINDLRVTHTEIGGLEESLTSDAMMFQRAQFTNTYRPAQVDIMEAINEDQALSGPELDHSKEKDPCLSPGSSLVSPTTYGSTKKVSQEHLHRHSQNTSSSGNSSQCPLGPETERGFTWPMQ